MLRILPLLAFLACGPPPAALAGYENAECPSNGLLGCDDALWRCEGGRWREVTRCDGPCYFLTDAGTGACGVPL